MNRTVGWDNSFLLLTGSRSKGTASAFTADKGMLWLREYEDCTFHHRRAADFLNISTLLPTESLRQLSQRVGETLAGGSALELLRVWSWKVEWKVRAMQVALGLGKAQNRRRTMRAELSRKITT